MRRLKAGLTRAASSVPVLKVDEERWEQDRMIFRVRALGQAASGHVDVADDHVRVEVTLPWLLQRFAEVAQAAIRKRGHLLLTKNKLTSRSGSPAPGSRLGLAVIFGLQHRHRQMLEQVSIAATSGASAAASLHGIAARDQASPSKLSARGQTRPLARTAQGFRDDDNQRRRGRGAAQRR